MLSNGEHHNPHMQRSWNKHGANAFSFLPLAVLEESEKLPTEQRLIDLHFLRGDKTFNIAREAVAFMKGRKHSEKTKKLMSSQRLGNKHCVGRKPWNKGVPMSEETKNRCSAALRNPSKETREKMRAAKVGKHPPNKGKRAAFCKRGHKQYLGNLYYRRDRKSFDCKVCRNIRSALKNNNHIED